MKNVIFCVIIGFIMIFPSIVLAETLFYDDFNDGDRVCPCRWHIPTWRWNGDGTYVGRTQFRCVPSPLPEIKNGNTIILLETYNPTATNGNWSFYGTDLISKRLFSLEEEGVHVTVRAKMDTSTRGIVGGIFLYALKPGSTTIHDEVDFELITNLPNRFQTNIYSNEPLGEGNSILLSYNSGTIRDYHIYEIKWQANEVSWFVDGMLVRTVTRNVPAGPMYFHLNAWAPGDEWALAYDQNLQPSSSAIYNQRFQMSVDYVHIQSIPPAPGKSMAPILLPLILDETQ